MSRYLNSSTRSRLKTVRCYLRLWHYHSNPGLLGLLLKLLLFPRSTARRLRLCFKLLPSFLGLLLLLFLSLFESVLNLPCCSPRSSVLTPLPNLCFFLSLLSGSTLSSEQLVMRLKLLCLILSCLKLSSSVDLRRAEE